MRTGWGQEGGEQAQAKGKGWGLEGEGRGVIKGGGGLGVIKGGGARGGGGRGHGPVGGMGGQRIRTLPQWGCSILLTSLALDSQTQAHE